MLTRLLVPASALLAALTLLPHSDARAGVVSQHSVLNQYNVVTTGDMEIYSHVDTNTFVGGNLKGNANSIFGANMSGSPIPTALTVVGSISGTDLKVNSGKNLVMTNTALGGSNVVMNGGGQRLNDPGLPSLAATITQELTNVSNAYKGLTANNFITKSPLDPSQPGSLVFDIQQVATIGGKTYAVFSIDGSVFNESKYQQGIQIGGSLSLINSVDTILVNVSGTSVLHDGAGNFSGLINDNAVRSKLVFNFFEATTLGIGQNRNFSGTILAPNAIVTKTNTSTDGGIFAREYRVLGGGETHVPIFTGYVPMNTPTVVPEPSTLALSFLGVGVLLTLRRRGHRKP